MLRIYLLQNWYALSDPMAEETLNDSEATPIGFSLNSMRAVPVRLPRRKRTASS